MRRAVALSAVACAVTVAVLCAIHRRTDSPTRAAVRVTRLKPRVMSGSSTCAAAFPLGDPCDTLDGGTVGAPGVGDAGPVCNITSAPYNAVPDASTAQTAAIQAAINACADAGGTVIVPAGTYLSGTLTLGSNMVLSLGTAATLAGVIPADVDAAAIDYPSPVPFPTPNNSNSPPAERSFLYANGAKNLTIVGPGTIDGNGGAEIWSQEAGTPDYDRPIAVWITNSQDITISDTQVLNSALWTVVAMQDVGVLVEDVTIASPNSKERDGLDVVDSHDVCVDNVTVSSEDDSICMKSGSLMGVDSVHVVNSTADGNKIPSGFLSEGNGLKLGTTSYGRFDNICFENINVSGYREAAMAVESVDGANIANVFFSNITLNQVESPFYVIFGDRYELPEGGVKKTGSLSCVTFQNITGSDVSMPWGSAITGTMTPDAGTLTIHNVTFSNVALDLLGGGQVSAVQPGEYDGSYPHPSNFGQLPGWAFWTRHADAVTFVAIDASVAPPDSRLPFNLQP